MAAQGLETVFMRFCTFGAGSVPGIAAATMDNARFAKLARDCRLIDGKRVNASDVDLIFVQACKRQGKAERRISFDAFLFALELLAVKRSPQLAPDDAIGDLYAHLLQQGVPTSSGTVASYEGGLTDTSKYTGAHKARFDDQGRGLGKEGRVQETAGVSDLSQITRPNLTQGMATLGISHRSPQEPHREAAAAAAGGGERPKSAAGGGRGGGGGVAVDRPPQSMEDVFVQFCVFGDRSGAVPMMDGSKFAKFTRDSGLLDKHLNATDVDLIFSKVKPRTERKLNYDQFLAACELLAEKKFGSAPDRMTRLVGICLAGEGPLATGTQAGYESHLTDTSLYTGAHRERFDADGRGKGKEGRVLDTAGVSDLSQITRPNLGAK